MVDEKDATQRRVYVLPTSLVSRIEAFQKDMRLPSEVEAVRLLLNEALKRRESPEDLATQLYFELAADAVQTVDLVRELVLDHPVVTRIAKDGSVWTFDCVDGSKFQIDTARHLRQYDDAHDKWLSYMPF